MEDIEVGEYIRTTYGEVGKYVGLSKGYDGFDYETRAWGHPFTTISSARFDELKSHSSSIINIIEVGDYVNGNKVDDIDYSAQIVYCNDYNLDDSLIRYRKDEIRYIVTNKLFENTEYEVE